MSYSIKIEGLDKLTAKIAKSANGPAFFDAVFSKNTRQSVTNLGKTTNKGFTGNTRRGWQLPSKMGLSSYRVVNDPKDNSGKINVARILDQGRGPVFPVKAKKLYIPLTNKGASKKAGTPIQKGLVYGVDYILAKSAGPFKGTRFIQKELEVRAKQIASDMVLEVQKLHG